MWQVASLVHAGVIEMAKCGYCHRKTGQILSTIFLQFFCDYIYTEKFASRIQFFL